MYVHMHMRLPTAEIWNKIRESIFIIKLGWLINISHYTGVFVLGIPSSFYWLSRVKWFWMWKFGWTWKNRPLEKKMPSCGGGLPLQQLPTENRGALRARERLKTRLKCTVLANWWRYAFYTAELRMFSRDRFQLGKLYRYARSYHKLKYWILPHTFLYKRNHHLCFGNTRWRHVRDFRPWSPRLSNGED